MKTKNVPYVLKKFGRRPLYTWGSLCIVYMRWRASTRWWGATTITTSSPIKTSVRRSLLTKVSASLCILCCVAVVQSTFYLLSDVLNSNISLLILSSVWPVSEQELPRLAGARACLWPCLHHEPGQGVCSKSRSSCQVRIMLTIFLNENHMGWCLMKRSLMTSMWTCRATFDDFETKHGKTYSNPGEREARLDLYRQNLRFIHSKNRQELAMIGYR